MVRNNFLFRDTAKGADARALCFSVIETANCNVLDLFGRLIPATGAAQTGRKYFRGTTDSATPLDQKSPQVLQAQIILTNLSFLTRSLFFITHRRILSPYYKYCYFSIFIPLNFI